MTRPRLLDAFCGAGGAAMGYQRAGFDVVGVDHVAQPHYPFEFHQADALEYIARHGHKFDAIHASPPCQCDSPISRYQRVAANYPQLIPATREALSSVGRLWIIENVPQAPLRADVILCGQMFGLAIYRHRAFEASVLLRRPAPCKHLFASRQPWSGYHRLADGVITVVGHTYRLAEGRIAMGIDWMATREELNEAIPPAYTEFLGAQLLDAVWGKEALT